MQLYESAVSLGEARGGERRRRDYLSEGIGYPATETKGPYDNWRTGSGRLAAQRTGSNIFLYQLALVIGLRDRGDGRYRRPLF